MSSARLGFIGVSTAQSLVNELFPRWSKTLGLGIGKVVGIDLPVNLTGDAIRSAVLRIREDTSVSGALVTTHKVAVWEHTRDLFKKFDEHAQRLCEVSCLSRNPQGDLVGHAKDPITAGLAWDQVVSSYHWSRHPEAELLILGSGGAGVALAWNVLQRESAPRMVTLTELNPKRLLAAKSHLQKFDRSQVHVSLTGTPAVADRHLGHLPPHSVVVNATGLGKDRPGSPLTDAAQFPKHGIVWEFNYRGERQFLTQAQEQMQAQQLQIVDGWDYFLLGWAHVSAEVFHFDLTPECFQTLKETAQPLRPI